MFLGRRRLLDGKKVDIGMLKTCNIFCWISLHNTGTYKVPIGLTGQMRRSVGTSLDRRTSTTGLTCPLCRTE
jgi:hypothetical protein